MSKIFKFQEGEGTFPHYLPLCDAHVYKMTHCVSGFRDYVSEGGTDTYPYFWKRFSPKGRLTLYDFLVGDKSVLTNRDM